MYTHINESSISELFFLYINSNNIIVCNSSHPRYFSPTNKSLSNIYSYHQFL